MRIRVIFILLLSVTLCPATDWQPVSPDLLALKTPKLDPHADAEAIFREARVKDSFTSGAYATHRVTNYKRIKLFTDRGVERWGNVEIPYYSNMRMSIADVKARTILSNGTITEVPGNTIFDTTVTKVGRVKVKVKKFAFPQLAPGAIIEYQYTEIYTEFLPQYITLPVQFEIPAWEVIYYVKPLVSSYFPYQMRYYPFNCAPSPWTESTGSVRQKGYMVTRVRDVPAHVEEPRSGADDDIKAWILLYYTASSQEKSEKYWRSLGRTLLDEFKRDVKVNAEVKALAAELTAAAETVEQKANALATYCQTKIGNVTYNAEGMTGESRDHYYKKLYKPEYNSNDTLKYKLGTSTDIIALFFALAQAAGLDPSYVRSGSANGAAFRADFFDRYLLRKQAVAIKDGSTTRYYNPGIPYLPPGMLKWDEQGQSALLADKEPKLFVLPASPPDRSVYHRNATLSLSPEGHLSGTVTLQYFGHAAVAEKLELEDQSPGSREETKKKEFEARFPGAQITNVVIKNATSPQGILTISYAISMENYGQRTGKRLFFQPAFFRLGARPFFSAATRVNPIFFSHAFEELDNVIFTLPPALALENADIPATFNIGKVGTYRLTASIGKETGKLEIIRRYIWGQGGQLYFDKTAYPALKAALNQINDADTHTLTLKEP